MSEDAPYHRPGAEVAAFLARDHRLLIDGAWVSPLAGGVIAVFNPAPEEQIATVVAAEAADVDLAVGAAHARLIWRRGGGRDGIEAYTEVKSIAVALQPPGDWLAING